MGWVAVRVGLFLNPNPFIQMRNSHASLNHFLIKNGIEPRSFAYFLSEYVKRKPNKNKSVLSILLSKQLRAHAELIAYHIRN